ncbi:MAG TPA: glutamine amidotransferase [Gammaproteobacteria bacterium]
MAPLSIWVTGEPVPPATARAGSFADMIRATTGAAWPGAWSVVDATDERAALPAADDVSGVIVTGSPARIADQLSWMRRVQDALANLVDANVPVLGICFGHQLLGMALGGRSGPNPRGREIGTVTLTLHASDPVVNGPQSFPVSMTHLDVVRELPPGASVIASTALDPYAAIRFAENAWGVQFHPEMDAEIIGDYIASLRDKLIGEGIDPDALLASRRDTPHAARVLERFAERAAARRSAER